MMLMFMFVFVFMLVCKCLRAIAVQMGGGVGQIHGTHSAVGVVNMPFRQMGMPSPLRQLHIHIDGADTVLGNVVDVQGKFVCKGEFS